MQSILANWKTTIAGGVALFAAISGIASAISSGEAVDWNTTIPAIIAAIGLIFSRDGDVSSERSGAKR